MAEQLIEARASGWEDAAKKLVREVRHYRIDVPNFHHLLNAAAKGGFTEITDDNLDDVLAFLSSRVESEPDHDAPMLPEAPASWNLTYYVGGRREQITLRGMTYAQIETQAKIARAWISDYADEPLIPNGASNGQQPDKQPVDLPATESATTTQQPPSSPQQSQDDNGLSFKPETLVANVLEGKVFWKVKGGRWSKYGVNIWPEVLEAANLNNLDPTQEYSLSNFKSAIYINNDKGQPSKVTALA